MRLFLTVFKHCELVTFPSRLRCITFLLSYSQHPVEVSKRGGKRKHITDATNAKKS